MVKPLKILSIFSGFFVWGTEWGTKYNSLSICSS